MTLITNGRSLSGIETCIEIGSLDLVFDIGFCPDSAVRYGHVAVSHGHVDHVGAIVSHAARRALMYPELPVPTYYVPFDSATHIEAMFRAAEKLDGATIPHIMVEMRPGDRRPLGRHAIEAFPTMHRGPSQGYRVLETRKKLKVEYRGLPGREIAAIRKSGIDPDDVVRACVVAYTGDTTVQCHKVNRFLRDAETLITEATFLEDTTRENAARHLHTHIADIARNEDLFCQPRVVLTHFSARYDKEEIQQFISSNLSPDLIGRVTLL